MTISSKCPGCGKRLSGPDSAAGHKVKCPKCGQVVPFPGAAGASDRDEAAGSTKLHKPSAADLAQALSQEAEPSGAKAARAAQAPEQDAPPKDEPSGEELSASLLTPAPARASSRRSSTTMSRMLARSSPYKTIRLLGVVMFGTGIVVAVLTFLGGLAGLIVGAMAGLHTALAVGVFVGAIVVAAVVLLVSKAASELMRLWADVGDRARHVTMMLEETFAQQRKEDLSDGGSR